MTTERPKLQMPKGAFPKLGKKNIILLVCVLLLVVASLTVGLVDLWNVVLLQPMLNFLIILSNVFFDNFGIAIVVLVIIVRLLMLPITLKQLKSTKAMSSLQPKLQEIQKKYGGDKIKLQQEMARVYKESGVNPIGCLWPMLIQFPIWIALYQSILKALAATPEELMSLSDRLYSSSFIISAVPLKETFLWLDLGRPDPYFIMAVLVAASMWVLQKMSTMPTSDPKQQSMNNMLTWMMPLMFGFFTISFPSGLALFWFVSNLIGIITQYFITGWGSLSFKKGARVPAPAAPGTSGIELSKGADIRGKESSGGVNQEGLADGQSREKRQDRRRSRRDGARRTRRKS
ncbi:MAG: YidC/Oxa1 family membrane protein insertase [Dehalococcoidia bacterium]